MTIDERYERKHRAHLSKYQKLIDALYNEICKEVGQMINSLVPLSTYWSGMDIFSIPAIKQKLNDIIAKYRKSLKGIVVNGVEKEWDFANKKYDEEVDTIFSGLKRRVLPSVLESYKQYNHGALNAFIERKEGGMNLSQRVWKYGELFRDEIEKTLAIGVEEGDDAGTLSRRLKQYLKYPDKLFRRVRDDKGRLKLSKNAKMFHPGQGVYRSSAKNAQRLAATEINMAYRHADTARRMQLPFVVGIRICLSNNHTCNGEPFYDICDILQGDYPKWFDFSGWHPKCRCYTISITKTNEEFIRDLDGVDRGSKNEVKDMPPQWKQWVAANKERIDKAEGRGTLPYFLRDNRWAWDGESQPPVSQAVPVELTPEAKRQQTLEAAKARHEARTEEDISNIKLNWNRRRLVQVIMAQREGYLPADLDTKSIRQDIVGGKYEDASRRLTSLLKAARRHAERTADDVRRIQDLADTRIYGQSYVDHIHKLEKALGIKRGKRMTFEEADTGRENPNYGPGEALKPWRMNCQTVTVVHELRRIGFDVQAMPNANGEVWEWFKRHNLTWQERFRDKDGIARGYPSFTNWKRINGYSNTTEARKREYLQELCKDKGRYEVFCKWKNCSSSHVFLAEREADGTLRVFCPQSHNNSFIDRFSDMEDLGVARIDNSFINPEFMERIVVAGKKQTAGVGGGTKGGPATDEVRERIFAIAQKRHDARTKEDVEEIKAKWNWRKTQNFAKENGWTIDLQSDASKLKGLREFDFISFANKVKESTGMSRVPERVSIEEDKQGWTLRLFEPRTISIERNFIQKGDKLECHHNFFSVDSRLQGQGVSKKVFAELSRQYDRIKVDTITLEANINVGGYAWAKAGFFAINKQSAKSAALNNPDWTDAALAIIDSYYKNHSDSEPFPMRLLAEKPWGKELLLNSYWLGVLNLKDKAARKVWDEYYGL